MSFAKSLKEGLVTNNPVLVQLIGMCPTLATSTSLTNGIGMGLSATAVLICSNIVISLLRKIIPSKVRIAAYITVIAGFVTMVDLLLQAFIPALSDALGVFIPLIVVNCIILGRAEAFAGKNSVIASAVDGLGMGVGFTMALCCMASVREIIGAGTFLSGAQNLLVLFGDNVLGGFDGFTLIPQDGVITPMTIFILAPGGFFTFGILMACANRIAEKKGKPKAELGGCKGCPMAANCSVLAQGKSCEEKKEGENA